MFPATIEQRKVITNSLDMFLKELDTNIPSSVTNDATDGPYLCTPEIYKFISEMNYGIFSPFINVITNQTTLENKPIYSIYKLNYMTHEFITCDDIITDFTDAFHNRIEAEDNNFRLQIISPQTFLEYYFAHLDNKYILLPLVYKTGVKYYGHQTFIAFDNFSKRVYLVDPNGRSTYFDSMYCNLVNEDKLNSVLEDELSYNFEINIDSLLYGYLNELKKIGLEYEFIPADVWNEQRIIINRTIPQSEIGLGHCVCTTLIIMHMLATTNLSPMEIYEIIFCLYNEQLLSLINDYSIGIYKMLVDL